MSAVQGIQRQRVPVLMRVLVAASVVAAVVAGVLGGLVRAGVQLPLAMPAQWLAPAVLQHAFLMVCGFMGTVIGIERAVAVKAAWAWGAPALSAAAGVLAIAGWHGASAWLAVLAAVVFVAVNVLVVRRQREPHTVLLLVSAMAWLGGNTVHAADPFGAAAVPWWFSFLVLTIAAERLEMTRLMRRRPGAAEALYLVLALMLAGAAAALPSPMAGLLLFGVALVALAAWLLAFDIARKTVRARGLSRYMAVCLLLGYAWLGLSGAAWVLLALGHGTRDLALHALALGFVFSMMLGHAPVILPALARIKVHFNAFFYVPLALLHSSLVVRLFLAPAEPRALALGSTWNALAMLLFAATMAGAALAWRRRHASSGSTRNVSAHH